ncbi:tol-pal system YbgF family protein [Thermodesulfobacteriota bacterium]
MVSKAALCLIVILHSVGIDAGDAGELFARANRLKSEGRYRESVDLYLDVAERFPGHKLTDDALAKAGRICDYDLFDVPSAIRNYGLFIERYPDSRSAERIRERRTYLEGLRSSDYEPYKLFHRLKQTYWSRDSGEIISTLDGLLAKYPDFAETDEVLFLLGSEHVKNGRYDMGRERFEALMAGFPASKLAHRAQAAVGDSYFEQREYQEAREAYERMGQYPGSFVEETVRARIDRVNKHIVRFRFFVAAACLLSLSVLVMLWRIHWGALDASHLLRAKWEIAALLAVMAYFEWVARAMSTTIRYSIVLSGLSVMAFVVLNALYLESVSLGRLRRFVHPLHALLVVACIVYMVYYSFDMTVAFEDSWNEYGSRIVFMVRSFFGGGM